MRDYTPFDTLSMSEAGDYRETYTVRDRSDVDLRISYDLTRSRRA
jgi:hypothetical protein